MRRALALALAACLLATLPATAAAAPTGQLTVIAKLKKRTQEGKRAYSFRQILFQAKDEVGRSRVHCELRSKKFAACTGTYRVEGGSIRVAADIKRGTKHPTLAIVRGTGAYLGASGLMKVDNLTRKTSRNTFTFAAP